MDQLIIEKFNGSHPQIIKEWLPKQNELFEADPSYKLTKKQRKHRFMIMIEKIFGVDLCKKHYKLVE